MADETKRRFVTRRAKAQSFNTNRAITASASRINLGERKSREDARAQTNGRQWHDPAWKAYDDIGEIKFAFNLLAAVSSRLRLYPGVVVDESKAPVPLTDGVTIERPEDEKPDPEQFTDGISPDLAQKADEIMSAVIGSSSIPNLIKAYTLNMSVPGECYLLYENQKLHCKSVSELMVSGSDKMQLKTVSGGFRDLASDATVGRVWRNHPRYSFESDSSMRGVLNECEELLVLGQAIRSIGRSKTNAGILYVPDQVEILSQTPTDDAEEEAAEQDTFMSELIVSYTEPLTNEKAGNSLIPLIMRGPADLADKIKYITTDRQIDQFLVERADRVLERVMQGIDVPKDIVTGLANVKYSNALVIDQSLYKAHVEPLALTLCDAITEIFLQPMLRASGEFDDAEVAKVVVWYDPSEVVVRPDRADDAEMLYDKHELSGDALRAATGFAPTDKPSEEELARRLAIEGTIPAEIISLLLKTTLPNVFKESGESATAGELPESLSNILNSGADDPTAVPAPLS